MKVLNSKELDKAGKLSLEKYISNNYIAKTSYKVKIHNSKKYLDFL